MHPDTGQQFSIDVKDSIYAGLVAEAINKLAPQDEKK